MPAFVLAADAGRARLFKVTGTARARALSEVEDLVSPNARLPNRDLMSDKTGRVFSRSRAGPGGAAARRSGAKSDFDPHTAEIARFAKCIARNLDARRRLNEFDELRIVAEPRFLGVLRAALSAPTRRLVSRELARDLSRATTARIGQSLFTE